MQAWLLKGGGGVEDEWLCVSFSLPTLELPLEVGRATQLLSLRGSSSVEAEDSVSGIAGRSSSLLLPLNPQDVRGRVESSSVA